jgi:tetratricopeptide (TPR) repeat protein
VEKRIENLESLLRAEARLDEDRRREAETLLEGYRRVLHLLRSPGSKDGDRASAVLFERLGSLEERFFEPLTPSEGSVEAALSLLSEKRELIRDAHLAGDHRAVVRACTGLEEAYGPDALTPETGLLFAVALAETGRTAEAIRVGERILPELEGRPGLVELRRRMVSWHLEAGNRAEARALREKLVDDVMERQRLLLQAERALGIPGAVARPAALPRPAGAPPAETSELSGPLADLIHRVNALVREKSYDQARLLLIRQRIRYTGESELEVIDRALDRVDRAEAADPERPPVAGTAAGESDRNLETARRRMEAEDFEGALDALNRLEEAGSEAGPEVAALRQQAASQFVQQRREAAARRFLMARNAQNPEEKASHLLASRRILKGLLERFPDAVLAPRIRSNLETVEEEMKRAGIPPQDEVSLE